MYVRMYVSAAAAERPSLTNTPLPLASATSFHKCHTDIYDKKKKRCLVAHQTNNEPDNSTKDRRRPPITTPAHLCPPFFLHSHPSPAPHTTMPTLISHPPPGNDTDHRNCHQSPMLVPTLLLHPPPALHPPPDYIAMQSMYMYVCVCVCVCMCLCMCVCMYVCVYMYVCMYVSIYKQDSDS